MRNFLLQRLYSFFGGFKIFGRFKRLRSPPFLNNNIKTPDLTIILRSSGVEMGVVDALVRVCSRIPKQRGMINQLEIKYFYHKA